ncbi:MAG: D-tyrosyl-tRNA(Tyr) deacylase [Cycloclasticus sp. symbiont of Bathymodiolus heckerae]|nr:MAG: D-tyrosyl-tRNA(Tyr) deacylase [Cycloclasticus sp. symbiont of Bathymodiolus heckerae]
MLTVIQRVTHASVSVNDIVIGNIDQGIVALLAIEKEDGEEHAKQLIDRIINYRIFPDQDDKMNLSLRNINGGLLLIPQFTLAADTQKGTRPSFTPAAHPRIAKPLFDFTVEYAAQQHPLIACGEFGADMQVSLCNDGPVTFTLKTKNSNS